MNTPLLGNICVHSVYQYWTSSEHRAARLPLACFREPPGALAAGCAIPSDEDGGNAAEAAGLGDGRPRGKSVGAVRAVGAAPRPGLAVSRQRFCLRAALPAGARLAGP